MVCPPEVISVSYSTSTGKAICLVMGYVLDCQLKNSVGLSGVRAATTCGGVATVEVGNLPPPAKVVRHFFRHTVAWLYENQSVSQTVTFYPATLCDVTLTLF